MDTLAFKSESSEADSERIDALSISEPGLAGNNSQERRKNKPESWSFERLRRKNDRPAFDLGVKKADANSVSKASSGVSDREQKAERRRLGKIVEQERLLPRLFIALLMACSASLMFVVPDYVSNTALEASPDGDGKLDEAAAAKLAASVEKIEPLAVAVVTTTPAGPSSERQQTTTTLADSTSSETEPSRLVASAEVIETTQLEPTTTSVAAQATTVAAQVEPNTVAPQAASNLAGNEGDADSAEPAEADQAPSDWVDAGNGVKVPPIAIEIRYCESRHDYQAANPVSSARGAYQFITGTWQGYADRMGIAARQAHLASNADQDRVMVAALDAEGTRPWNASKHCWG